VLVRAIEKEFGSLAALVNDALESSRLLFLGRERGVDSRVHHPTPTALLLSPFSLSFPVATGLVDNIDTRSFPPNFAPVIEMARFGRNFVQEFGVWNFMLGFVVISGCPLAGEAQLSFSGETRVVAM
jgi:hypothetical protein